MRLWYLIQFMEIKAANPDVLLAMEGRSSRLAILKPALELILSSKQSAINSSFMARMQRSPPENLGSLGQSYVARSSIWSNVVDELTCKPPALA
jgi:hypothetical protein